MLELSLGEHVSSTSINHPYLATTDGLQYFLIVERIVVVSMDTFTEGLFALMSAFYAFDMAYPKNHGAILMFVQHLVMRIDNISETLPPNVTRVYSAMQHF